MRGWSSACLPLSTAKRARWPSAVHNAIVGEEGGGCKFYVGRMGWREAEEGGRGRSHTASSKPAAAGSDDGEDGHDIR